MNPFSKLPESYDKVAKETLTIIKVNYPTLVSAWHAPEISGWQDTIEVKCDTGYAIHYGNRVESISPFVAFVLEKVLNVTVKDHRYGEKTYIYGENTNV
jgi:hypothetical protein